MAWLLIPTALARGAEWVAHATQLAMLWLAILATVSLAKRLDLSMPWAAASGLILVAMPAVLGMAGTAMPDVSAMALGVAGIERLMAWSQNRRYSQAFLAAILLGLAPLARPHLILLFGVGGILLLKPMFSLTALRDRPTTFFPLLAAPLITAGISYITRDSSSGIVSSAYYSSGSISLFVSNFVALPIHWVLAMTFALPWLVLRWRSILHDRLLLFIAAAGTIISASALAYLSRQSVPLSIIAGLGMVALWDVIADGWHRRDSVQSGLGLWLLIALPAVVYNQLPPKYLVASAPAAALLIARELSLRKGKKPWLVLGVTVMLGTCLGVAILRADAAFANLGRRAATELIAPNVAAGKRVWFVGSWGFQWYAENAGAHAVTLTPPYPLPGDLIVVSLASPRNDKVLDMLSRQYPHISQVAFLADASPGGRIMNKRLNAGFYSNASGYLPWVWSDSMVDQVTVWLLE